ncbi:MAG TPA: ABC transporter transmembrane domain-containing protein [Ktedonobacteraceae bacterium]|nr:ABC transporter transmembrane domain-containing protein [Ktedonobacteraceae bacterium]
MDLFKFLYRNLKGYRLLVVLAILITVAQVGADVLTALPLKYIPSKIANAGNDPACTAPFLNPILDWFDTPQIDPSLIDPVTGKAVPPTPTLCPVNPTDIAAAANPVLTHHTVLGVVVFSVIMLVVFGILSALLAYLDLFLAAHISQNLTARMRNQLFDHLQRLSLDWHGKQKKGDLVQRVTGNIADIEKFVTDGLVDLLSGILTLIGVAVVMIVISPSFTFISLAIAPALFLIVLIYTRLIKAEARKAARAAGQVADVATEDINALTVIKVFTREEREAIRFGGYVDKNRKAGLRATGLQAQFAPIAEFLVIMGTAIVLGVGGYVASGKTLVFGPLIIGAGTIDIGTLILFLTFLKMLYQPMRDLSKLSNLASSAGSGAERIQEVLDQAPEVTDNQAPYYGPQRLRGEITFDNVVFGYTKDRPVLKGITLHIAAGRKIALVGLSGGGKTTLVKLIPRFYELEQGGGSVRIDGVDSRMYPLRVLRQNISMVLQDSVLFEGTIRDNIAVGKPGASEQEIIEAAKKADIHTMILQTLGGYDRMLREQGKDLSGGQRQRMAIARAILRDAPILILDEPTAALDVESEAEVMHALNKLIIGRTVITISHRLSTLGNVEEIIVLKEGIVAERGTFRELKRQGGIFAKLLEEQNRYSAENPGEQSVIRSAFVQRPADQEPLPIRATLPANAAPDRQSQPFQGMRPIQGMQPPAQGAQPPAAVIQVEMDGKILSEHKLEKPLLTIGRIPGNDILVPNQRVSRLHARLRLVQGVWVIEDAESVNGIVYQGNRVERMVLTNGDRISLAKSAALIYKTASFPNR